MKGGENMQLRNEYEISVLPLRSLRISNERTDDVLHWDKLTITDSTCVIIINKTRYEFKSDPKTMKWILMYIDGV